LGASLFIGCGGGGGPGPFRAVYDVSTGRITLAPGEERIMCVDRRLPTNRATDIVRIASDLTLGGHHLIFYRSNATSESAVAYRCQSFSDILQGTQPLYIAQRAQSQLDFPPGVAYR